MLSQAVRTGAASRDFFGTAYGQHEEKFDGFQLGGGSVQVDDTLLLIEPDAALAYEATQKAAVTATAPSITTGGNAEPPATVTGGGTPQPGTTEPGVAAVRARSFHGTVEVAPATAKMRLVQFAEEIIAVLSSDPNASVRVVVEVSAEFPNGAKDTIKRAVSENARSLGLKSADWE